MEIHLLIPVAGLLMLIDAAGLNEEKVKLSAKDIRYNQKGNVLYATVLGVPSTNVSLKLLGKKKEHAKIKSIKVR
jgi:alpha-L-fucosidase